MSASLAAKVRSFDMPHFFFFCRPVILTQTPDNHMINGTKLLNVAGMTRGRRDGILKSEKTRHVVKIGPMHLKGVWIPFERALDFANKEKITEQLYPLFVHDIGALLYHPSNQNRAGVTAMNAVDRRRADQRYIGAPQTTQAPPLHHAMTNPVGSQISQPQHSIAPHPNSAGRPGLDRAHTFPTPPTSASSLIGMSGQQGSYEWGNTGVANMQGSQQLSIDTGLSNARSVPTTPASTPPGSLQNMPQYQTSQAYDGSRQMYATSTPQSAPYSSQSQPLMRYGAPLQTPTYGKTDMAPPSRGGDSEHQPETKQEPYGGQSSDHTRHSHAGVEEPEHDNDNEYTHSSAGYNANRAQYSYGANTAPTALHGGDHNLSPEMTSSPSHQNGSGRATPRTATAPQPQWASQYGTQRGPQQASDSLYNVVSDPRPNGAVGADGYAAPGPVQAAYPSQTYGSVNGANQSLKRGRDLSDDEADPYGRPGSRDVGDDVDGLKRRKTIHEGQMGGAVGANAYDGGAAGNMQRVRNSISQRRK